MEKKYKIIIWILVILLTLILIIIPTGMRTVSISRCNTECDKFDSLGFDVIYSGNWKIDDLCVCFGDDWIKTFKLGT